MAHLIDQTTGQAAIAFVGEVPWHGLGQRLTAGADLEIWRREAGLAYKVERTPVLFQRAGAGASDRIDTMEGRDVLYRSDTGAALSVVSRSYQVVQPGEVLDFFGRLAEAGGFELETAGALSEGRRVWGLARVNDGAPVVGQDTVRPYLLLATSYDGTMATTAKFTAIRVVCNNTLTMAAGGSMKDAGWQAEQDATVGPVVQCVRVPHMKKFDAGAVRQQLGIVLTAWDRWLVEARLLAQVDVTEAQADKLVFDLLSTVQRPPKGQPLSDVRASRGYKRLMSLFGGEQIGADLCGTSSAWALLNAVTDFVDHERGRSNDTRMTSAWFGAGEGLKLRAWDAARALAVKAGALDLACIG
jgi:phage/plasmid-like protein (TIGR03299 family)